MLNSHYHRLCEVALPFANRQKYMHTFNVADPKMPEGYEDYLAPVQRLLRTAGISHSTLIHMTVDEKVVSAGMSQRKPLPHVDGCFIPKAGHWGHGDGGGWNHYCNNVSSEKLARMAVIVAASVEGCRVWDGQFDAEPTSCGDLSHIADQLGAGKILPANVGYLLSPDCVHESLRFERPTQRTFLRLAFSV